MREVSLQLQDSLTKLEAVQKSDEDKKDELEKIKSAYENDVSALKFQISDEAIKYAEAMKVCNKTFKKVYL